MDGPDGHDSKKFSALCKAAEDGEIKEIEDLLKDKDLLLKINDRDTYNLRPIMHALMKGQIDAARLLQSKGANVDRTHLHYEARPDSKDRTKRLATRINGLIEMHAMELLTDKERRRMSIKSINDLAVVFVAEYWENYDMYVDEDLFETDVDERDEYETQFPYMSTEDRQKVHNLFVSSVGKQLGMLNLSIDELSNRVLSKLDLSQSRVLYNIHPTLREGIPSSNKMISRFNARFISRGESFNLKSGR